MFRPSQEEIAALLSQSGQKRYLYFVQKVADWEQVWGIGDDAGWSVFTDGEGAVEAFPIWPAEAYAAVCCSDAWSERVPKAIDLNDWQENWLPGLSADGRKVAVFPAMSSGEAGSAGLVVLPEKLRHDIAEVIAQFG